MNTLDQNIWIERVKRENKAQQKFDVVSMINAERSNMCTTHSALRHYLKDNTSPQAMK